MKKDREITCNQTTETPTEAESEAADEGRATKKQEQEDHKQLQPGSMGRKSAETMEEMAISTEARTEHETAATEKKDASTKGTDAGKQKLLRKKHDLKKHHK